jgi:hypothetical protein
MAVLVSNAAPRGPLALLDFGGSHTHPGTSETALRGVPRPALATGSLLDAIGALTFNVPALPGLVADALLYCLIGEVVTVVEQALDG